MSYEAYEAVWQSSESTSSARTTLLAMADFASKTNRYTCTASVETLAKMVGVSTRQIQKNARALEELGELRVIEGTGRSNYNVYDLKPMMLKHESQFTLSAHDSAGKGEQEDTHQASERVNSGTERVNHSTEKGEPQFDRTINNQTEPEKELINGFHEKTGLVPPHESQDAYREKWLTPMSSILRLCNGDVGEAAHIRDKSIDLLWASDKYRVSTPKSILVTASNLVNSGRASSATNGTGGAVYQANPTTGAY